MNEGIIPVEEQDADELEAWCDGHKKTLGEHTAEETMEDLGTRMDARAGLEVYRQLDPKREGRPRRRWRWP
jgi:hypothetical protein